MQPNLFDFAPSELSQDAFLCWALAHADPERGKDRSEIQALGHAFLSAIFAKDDTASPPPQIRSVKVRRQVQSIDILVEVNESIAIVLEDKVGTTEHSDQLARYRKVVAKRGYGEEGKRIILIYLQTGNQCTYKQVRDAGYHVFSRLDLLALLEGPVGSFAQDRSDIVLDFTRRLRRIEAEVQSYKELAYKDWTANARMGFLMALQQAFPSARWRYVANKGGGLFAFFWGGKKAEEDVKLYLQVEASTARLGLCVKLDTTRKEDLKVLRKKWHKVILALAPSLELEATRPSKFGSGKTMTVATFRDFPILDAQGRVDVPMICDLMGRAENLLDVCLAHTVRPREATELPCPRLRLLEIRSRRSKVDLSMIGQRACYRHPPIVDNSALEIE
ncbi:PD-(D/E)XK nuclease family protein [Caballeronia novacaledonica]|uniref:PD-(D/E)XK nuclease family protein n=2 Tax=Caballeronia novacaledonica TaxID=1544861 RepID=A0AA37IEK9_9BURK|nr:PD-(D/E)XK nuclease family protein [Caballeronia novacaledonica]GJH19075.1 PD-(D/E)XK nuclease family protein [Caballeronia novacaledonica]GJH28405.1 PD-(D/E)XK nuclease family protein [Caballeronia novacaledonica]